MLRAGTVGDDDESAWFFDLDNVPHAYRHDDRARRGHPRRDDRADGAHRRRKQRRADFVRHRAYGTALLARVEATAITEQ